MPSMLNVVLSAVMVLLLALALALVDAQHPEPTECGWFGKGPLCSPNSKCPIGYKQVTVSGGQMRWANTDKVFVPPGFGNHCITGQKALCCKRPMSTTSSYHPAVCGWFGTSPFCAGECPSHYHQVTYTDASCDHVRANELPYIGDEANDKFCPPPGFGQSCVRGLKVLCCEKGQPWLED